MKFKISIKSVNHAVAYNDKGELLGEVSKVISSDPKKRFVVFWGGGFTKAPRQAKEVDTLNEGIKYLEKVLTK